MGNTEYSNTSTHNIVKATTLDKEHLHSPYPLIVENSRICSTTNKEEGGGKAYLVYEQPGILLASLQGNFSELVSKGL